MLTSGWLHTLTSSSIMVCKGKCVVCILFCKVVWAEEVARSLYWPFAAYRNPVQGEGLTGAGQPQARWIILPVTWLKIGDIPTNLDYSFTRDCRIVKNSNENVPYFKRADQCLLCDIS